MINRYFMYLGPGAETLALGFIVATDPVDPYFSQVLCLAPCGRA